MKMYIILLCLLSTLALNVQGMVPLPPPLSYPPSPPPSPSILPMSPSPYPMPPSPYPIPLPPTPFPCTCAPGPPICASNGQTYYGECNMRCASMAHRIQLYVVYYGRCEDIYVIGSSNPGLGAGAPGLGK